MNDFKGAALMLDALPKANAMLGDKGYDANWFRDALAACGMRLVSHQRPIESSRFRTTGCFTSNATRSKTCSGGSRTGGESIRATTVPHTPSCPQSASQRQSSSGSIYES